MSVFTVIAALVGLALVAAVAAHGPALVARGIAKAIWNLGQVRGERLAAVLVASRQQPTDRWARTSKEERQLLARSLAGAMNRTQMRSLLPNAI